MFRGRCFAVLLLLCPLLSLAAEEESGESPSGREQWFVHQRVNKNGEVGARERLRALAHRQHQQAAGDAAFPSQNWQLIGPQPENAGTIAISAGRVTALVVDPRSTNTVYAGTAEGGVWKTTDGGVNWLPLTDTQPSLSIGSLTLDPSNPDTIYAATGEDNFNYDGYFGAGILKSTDGGMTWTSIGQDIFTGAVIGSIAVNPSNSQSLIIAAGYYGGLYSSTDGGLTWANPVSNIDATAVAFNPSDGNQVWAGVGSIFADQSNGLYHSTDGGVTWTIVSTPPLPQSGIGRVAIAFAPSNPQTIYVGMSGVEPNDSEFLGCFVSTDGGTTWTANAAGYAGDWYRNTLAVSPIDPQFAVGGGLDAWVTQDGNTTWTSADTGELLHVDQHAFAFSADGSVLYAGDDGGVFSAPTSGSAPLWSSLNSTLAITQFYPGFSAHPTDTTVTIGGTQDNGAQLYSGNLKWTYVTCGDSGAAYIVPQNPEAVYVTCEGAGFFRSLSGGRANTFAQYMTGIPSSEVPFVGTVTGDPSDPNVAWWGGATNLWLSTSQGTKWTKATASLPANSIDTISAIGVVSTDGNSVITGDSAGDIFCSTNAKATAPVWAACGAAIQTQDVTISSVVPDPLASGAAYLTQTGYGNDHIFHTTDAGQTWTDLQGDLTDVPVSAVLVDQDAGFLYAATDVGVFMSANNGGHWQPLGNGLPNTVITGLQFYRTARLLRASSHGRSMWDITLPISPPTLGNNAIVNSASFTAVAPGSIAAAFGTSMTDGVESAGVIPLPPSLAGATLTIGGVNAPVFFASPGQINVQIPWEAAVGSTTATLTIGAQSSTAPASIAQYAPGIYTLSSSGQGQGVIVNSLTFAWAAPAGSIPGINSAPVSGGDFITIYCTGLGAVSNQPPDGAPAPSTPLSQTTQGVLVNIGGVAAPAQFAGLVPGLVGFYQVNASVPNGLTASGSVPLFISIGGATSNTVTIAVQ